MESVTLIDKPAVGKRLRNTRYALGFNKLRDFANTMGVEESRLGKWENGLAMVPPWFVWRLRNRYKISFDWIYVADDSNLPHWLVLLLTTNGKENG